MLVAPVIHPDGLENADVTPRAPDRPRYHLIAMPTCRFDNPNVHLCLAYALSYSFTAPAISAF